MQPREGQAMIEYVWPADGPEIKETTGEDLQEVRAELRAKSKRKITT